MGAKLTQFCRPDRFYKHGIASYRGCAVDCVEHRIVNGSTLLFYNETLYKVCF